MNLLNFPETPADNCRPVGVRLLGAEAERDPSADQVPQVADQVQLSGEEISQSDPGFANFVKGSRVLYHQVFKEWASSGMPFMDHNFTYITIWGVRSFARL